MSPIRNPRHEDGRLRADGRAAAQALGRAWSAVLDAETGPAVGDALREYGDAARMYAAAAHAARRLHGASVVPKGSMR